MSNESIIKLLTNARVALEQGGKYDWNGELQECDELLQMAIEELRKPQD